MKVVDFKKVDIRQEELVVLRNVDFDIEAGELVYLCGKVGSGKSTFLRTLYAELPIVKGEGSVLSYNLNNVKTRDIPMLRRKIGIVFQDFKLLGDRSVYDNLVFVLKSTGWKDKRKIDEQIELVLSTVGLSKKSYKRPHQLSGGEQQRVVIARALLNSPELIVADEPTGNLDTETSMELFLLLSEIAKSGTAVIIATHNMGLVAQFPGRVFFCEDEALIEKEN